MRRLAATLLAGLLFFGAGCSFIPSNWNPFGTPVTRAETAEKKAEIAQGKVLSAVQEEIHKFNYAVDRAITGNPHGLPVAQQHGRTAQQLVDQSLGPPVLASDIRWRELIDQQTSLDSQVRKTAEENNAKRLEQISKLSAELEMREGAVERANQKALEYANELQGFKDRILKWVWIVGALFALYFLGQILQLLAHFNPAFASAANVVNAVVSPALHAGFHKARQIIAGKAPAQS